MAAKGKSNKGRSETSTTKLSLAFKDDEKSMLAFKVLSVDKTKKVLEAGDVDHLESIVSDILEIHDTTHSFIEYIRLDYYVSGLWWCREQNFTAEQTSAFYTILESLLKNIQNPEKETTLVDCVIELKQLLGSFYQDTTEASGSSPATASLFNAGQVNDTLEYFHTSLFQHYKLYSCFFQDPPQEFIIGQEIALRVPGSAVLPWPAPLVEAIPEEIVKQPTSQESVLDSVGTKEKEDDGQIRSEAQLEADAKLEETLLSRLSLDEVKHIIASVYAEMSAGVEEAIAEKIKEKENAFLHRINQLHIVDKT